MEEDDVTRHVQRVVEAIDNELAQISVNAQDNALPGSRSQRMAELFDNYASTVTPSGLSGRVDLLVNRLGGANVLLLTDTSGKIIWGWGYDEETQELTLPPKTLRAELDPSKAGLLLRHPDGEASFTGILLLDEGRMLVVSEYFTSSEGEGSFLETLLVGKNLEEQEVEHLEVLTRLSMEIPRIDALPADFELVRSSLTEDKPIFVQPLDTTGSEEKVAGYTVLNDINGDQALMVRADVSRDIMDEGNKSLDFLLIAMAVLGVVLVLLIAYLLDKLVLSRMARLNSQVSSIDTGADLETRVSVPGTDELSNLAGAINGMLGDIQTERGRAENLLLNVLRQPISERLKGGETVIVDSFPLVSVLFSDTVGFTKLSASMSAEELVALLNRTFSAFDALADKHGLEKIKTIGDAYMVVGGVPLSVENNAERIAEMALDMHSEVARLNSENKISIDIRIGIHAGPVVAGVIGVRKFSYDLWGDAVNTAARMESHGLPGLIQMTEDMYNGIASSGKFDIEDRGMIDVKGKGDMHTYILKGREVALASATADD